MFNRCIDKTLDRGVLVCTIYELRKEKIFYSTVENAHESVRALITRANCTFTSRLIACFSFHRESKELVAFGCEINSLRPNAAQLCGYYKNI